jgi:hypothetical protein
MDRAWPVEAPVEALTIQCACSSATRLKTVWAEWLQALDEICFVLPAPWQHCTLAK